VTNPPINRPVLTERLFAFLKTGVGPTIKLGRGVAPPAGGWPEGNPRNGPWVPYSVLKAGPATTPAPGFPEQMARRRVSWQVTYQLTAHHTSESAVDEVAQAQRDVVVGWTGVVNLGDVAWNIEALEVPRLGATERDDSTDPAHWRVTDDVSLRVYRETSR
jgi:hypothetical protein